MRKHPGLWLWNPLSRHLRWRCPPDSGDVTSPLTIFLCTAVSGIEVAANRRCVIQVMKLWFFLLVLRALL